MAELITHTTKDDLAEIFQLFEDSIAYQEKNGFPVWRNYDRGAITRDIDEGNQYKIVREGTTALVFSVGYRDRIIWRSMDTGDAIYLHRIVINPAFKGQRLFGKVVDWAKEHIASRGLKHIRMDTWADNPTIISYYQSFGFRIVETYTTPDTAELPVHNRNLTLTLLEYQQ